MKCPVCGGGLSPETLFETGDGVCNVVFDDASAPAFLGGHRVELSASRARVCLDCGHVQVFLAKPDQERLRASIGRVVPRDRR